MSYFGSVESDGDVGVGEGFFGENFSVIGGTPAEDIEGEDGDVGVCGEFLESC